MLGYLRVHPAAVGLEEDREDGGQDDVQPVLQGGLRRLLTEYGQRDVTAAAQRQAPGEPDCDQVPREAPRDLRRVREEDVTRNQLCKRRPGGRRQEGWQ